jgi:hypothetical protein
MRLGPSGSWHVRISCWTGACFQQSIPKGYLDRLVKKSAGPVIASITITIVTTCTTTTIEMKKDYRDRWLGVTFVLFLLLSVTGG